MLNSIVKTFWQNITNSVLPPLCTICTTALNDHGGLCPKCWCLLAHIEKPYCERLGTPFGANEGGATISLQALTNPPSFEKARAAVELNETAKTLIYRLKYSDHLECAHSMATLMSRAGAQIIAQADMIIPMPLHFLRIWKRKYNQSEKLARIIAQKNQKPLELNALRRHKHTPPQVGKTKSQRLSNVQNAFALTKTGKLKIQGKTILLIDDVFTTGATADSATKTLLRGGAASVNILTFAVVTQNLQSLES